MIAKNLEQINSKIQAAISASGRDPNSVKLLAVTKQVMVPQIIEAINSGQELFGENYVQEAKSKILQIKTELKRQCEFHFIGRLQTNKVKHVVGNFSLIHTVDSLKLAEEINKVAKKAELIQKVLIQVNISQEITKSGVMPKGTEALARDLLALKNIELCGLMSIGSWEVESGSTGLRLQEFIELRNLKDKVSSELGIKLAELSMGMSDDFELAIKEGSTIVRVGSGVFGERNQ